MTGQAAANIELIRRSAADGLTAQQSAARMGVSYSYVSALARSSGIKFVRPPSRTRKTLPTQRTSQMAALYKSGKTLQEIGDQFGLTRERVRQLITKYHGLTRKNGGEHKRALEKRAIFEAKRNTRSLKGWGCNWDQYVVIRNLKKPTRAFSMQHRNAKNRGIGWELNLWQWWSIWQQSGKWSERGRGQGYVMCRNGDAGPYAVGNVFIALAAENSSEQGRNKSGLPRGVRKNKRYAGYTAFRMINGKKYRLGSHPTPELAHAAYLAFEPSQQVAA